MSTNLAVYQPTNLQDAQALAKMWAGAGLVPQAFRGKPNDILLVMARGADMGLSPVQSLHAFYVINGRVGMYSDALVGVVVGKPFCRYFRLVSSDDRQATYETLREGSPEPVKLSYTIEQAKAAGLTSNATYQKHPAAMLRARCSAALARATYPDLVAGIYEPSELDEVTFKGVPGSSPGPVAGAGDGGSVSHSAEASVSQHLVEPVEGEWFEEHAPEVTEETEPDAEPEAARVPFGKRQGTAVTDLTMRDLSWYLQAADKAIVDPEKAHFVEQNQAWRDAVEAEIKRRG